MSPVPLEDLGATPGERRLLRRVYLVIVVLGVGVGFGVYAAGVENRVGRLEDHARDERDARCSMARNVYSLCLRTSTECEQVSASCRQDSRGGR